MSKRDKPLYLKVTPEEREAIDNLSSKLGLTLAKSVGYSVKFTERNLRNLSNQKK